MIYERYHTRQIADFGGIARQTPLLAFFMVFLTLASIGLPGLNGFAGEFLMLLGMFQRAGPTRRRAWPSSTASSPCWPSAASCWGHGTCCGWCAGLLRPVARARRHTPPAPCATSACAKSWPWRRCACVIVWIGVQPEFFLDRMAPTLDAYRPRAGDAEPDGTEARQVADGRSVFRAASATDHRIARIHASFALHLAAAAEIVLLLTVPWRSTWPARCARRGGRGYGRLDSPAACLVHLAAAWPVAIGQARRHAGGPDPGRSAGRYGRWLALAVGAVLVLMSLAAAGRRRHRRVPRHAPAGHCRADARGRGGRPGAAVRRPGVDLHSHLHPALPGPPRRRLPGSGGQVLLPQRAGLGHVPLRPELPLRDDRLDATGRPSARRWPIRGRWPAGCGRWSKWPWC